MANSTATPEIDVYLQASYLQAGAIRHDSVLHKHRAEKIIFSILGTIGLTIVMCAVYFLLRRRLRKISNMEVDDEKEVDVGAFVAHDSDDKTGFELFLSTGNHMYPSIHSSNSAKKAKTTELDVALPMVFYTKAEVTAAQARTFKWNLQEESVLAHEGERTETSAPSEYLAYGPGDRSSILADDSISVVAEQPNLKVNREQKPLGART